MQPLLFRAARAALLCAVAAVTASPVSAAPKPTSMVPARAQVLPAAPRLADGVAAAPPVRLVPINRPQPRASASTRRRAPLSAIRGANRLSRQAPAPEGFINSAMFYDYMPGAIYELHTSPRFISTIALKPGERLISKAAGDTVRWVMGETQQGSGPNAQTLVFVKPIRGDLRTNVVLTTDQRTYMLEAVSHAGDAYTSIISWNYPRDQLADLSSAGILAGGDPAASIGDVAVDRLNFGYSIKAKGGRAPAWMPERVFDDGSKTYIQFAPNLGTTEAPPLFVIGDNKQAELVNYRVQGRYYVIDRLISVAELRLGEKNQQIVRIARKAGGRS